jgi:hypothetical protein
MNNKLKSLLPFVVLLLALTGCQKKNETTSIETTANPTTNAPEVCPTCSFPDSVWTGTQAVPKLIFKFKFDSTQARLNNTGAPSVTVAPGNAAQSPRVNGMSAVYIELAQNDQVQVGQGVVLYKATETSCGGSKAVAFCRSVVSKQGDVFFSVPLSQVTAGSYKWLRIAVGYQNYKIRIKNTSAGMTDGTLASFLAINTYVSKYKMRSYVMTPQFTGNKTQGYWGFYADIFGTALKVEGQAAQTTLVNPNASAPLPAGSDIITGELYSSGISATQPLVIAGTETQDLIITVSLSTNKSFEWKELTADGLFQPDIGEFVVDMGLRGMVPRY